MTSHMISVLFLIPTLDRGGAENVLVNLVNKLNPNKYQITVQTLFDRDSQKNRLREDIEYRTFLYHQFRGNSKLFSAIPAGLLYRRIVKKRYDIIVSYLEGPTTHIISGCPYRDTKKVCWFHTQLNPRRFQVGFWGRHAALQAYRKMDAIIFVSSKIKESFEHIAGDLGVKTAVLYNTINDEEIRNLAREELKDFSFPKKSINIISAGKITDVKGYDRLAKVQCRLIREGVESHIFILGTGADRDRIEEYVREKGISDYFTFLGFKDNPYKYIARADLFVCSSRREGYSTAISEALVLGVPVLSTSCSGTEELLGENDEYGMTVDNSEEGLYEGLKRIICYDELLDHYRKAAEKRSILFSGKNTKAAVEQMLDEMYGETDE